MSKNNQQRKVLAQDVALARHSVIAPLVCRELSQDEYTAELARVRAAIHFFPDGPRRVSDRSIRRWRQHYRDGRSASGEAGFDALIPDVRSDMGLARNLDQDIIARAVTLRQEAPSRKTKRLIELMKSEAKAAGKKLPEIPESTLNYHLRACGATRRKLGSKSRAFRRFEHPYRNACWQGDWCDGPWLPHPTKPGEMRQCYLHGFIDDRTRYVPHAEFYFRQNLPCLEDCYRKAVLKGGVPEICYVDYVDINIIDGKHWGEVAIESLSEVVSWATRPNVRRYFQSFNQILMTSSQPGDTVTKCSLCSAASPTIQNPTCLVA